MITLLFFIAFAALLVNGTGLLTLLAEVAILAIVIWAIFALLTWAGITIPPPVRIILVSLGSILLIILLFRAFGYAI